MHILILMSLVEVPLRNGSTLIPFMASEIVTARKSDEKSMNAGNNLNALNCKHKLEKSYFK